MKRNQAGQRGGVSNVPGTAPDLSIIIVSYNSRALLEQCLTSIRRYPPPVPFETIVVDNASGDGSPALVAEQFPEVHLLRNEDNIGFGAANNRGLQAARGNLVLFLNSDTELLQGSLDPLFDRLAMQPKVGIVGPLSQNADGGAYPSICPFPDLVFLFLTHTNLRGRFNANYWINPYREVWERAYRTEEPVAVDWLAGACFMVRRSLLNDIGWFDEGYFFYMEETDLCMRAHQAGWDVELVPKGRIVHHGGGSTGKAKAGLLTLSSALSELRFFQLHRSRVASLILRCQFVVEYWLKRLFVARDDPRRWAYREIVRAVLGLRPAQVTKEDREGGSTLRSGVEKVER